MAKITKSADAPADAKTFSLAGAQFSFENESVYSTDDAGVIANAVEHPWLDVELEPAAETPTGSGSHEDPDERKAALRQYAEANYAVVPEQTDAPDPVPVATVAPPAPVVESSTERAPRRSDREVAV